MYGVCLLKVKPILSSEFQRIHSVRRTEMHLLKYKMMIKLSHLISNLNHDLSELVKMTSTFAITTLKGLERSVRFSCT